MSLFNSLFIGAGTIAGKVIGVFFVLFLFAFQFMIWEHLSGWLCFLAYVTEIVLYASYIAWMRKSPTSEELDKLMAKEMSVEYESAEHRAADLRLKRTLAQLERNSRKRKY